MTTVATEEGDGRVICDKHNFCAFHTASPLVKCLHNTKELLLTCGVVDLSRSELLAPVSNRSAFLNQHTSCAEQGCT